MRHEQDFIGISGLKRFAGITRVLTRNGFGMLADRFAKRSPQLRNVRVCARGSHYPPPAASAAC